MSCSTDYTFRPFSNDNTFRWSRPNGKCEEIKNGIVKTIFQHLQGCVGDYCNPDRPEASDVVDVVIKRDFDDRTVKLSYPRLNEWQYVAVLNCATRAWTSDEMEKHCSLKWAK